MSSSNCCFLTCIQVSQEAGQVVWYFHLFQTFPQFIVIHTVKGFGIVNKAEIDVFLELSCIISGARNLWFCFWLCHATCGILVLQYGIEPRPSAVKACSPNSWTARELHIMLICLITVDVNLSHLSLCLLGFSTVKLLFFPL